MSLNHTPGQLVIGETYINDGEGEDGKPEIALRIVGGHYNGAGPAVVLSFGPNAPDMQQANARRMVACWKSCEHIPTDKIETINKIGGLVGIMGKANQENAKLVAMTAERDAARALLSDILKADDQSTKELAAMGLPLQPVEMTERIRAFLYPKVAG